MYISNDGTLQDTHIKSEVVTKKEFDIHNFDLRKVLMMYSNSKNVLRNYEKNRIDGLIAHRKLDKKERGYICNAIVQWHIDEIIMVETQHFHELFDVIKLIFPEELENSYFTPSVSITVDNETKRKKQLCPRGSLYSAWRSKIEKARKEAVAYNQDVTPYYVHKKKSSISSFNVEPNQAEPSTLEDKKWLSEYFEPWDTVLVKWKKTFPLRLVDLKTSFDVAVHNWPMFEKNTSYQLVDSDFNEKYPGKDTLKDLWSKYRKAIIELVQKKCDKKKQSAFAKFNQNKIEDADKNWEGILAIHAIFYLVPNKNKMAKQSIQSILFKAPIGSRIDDLVKELSHKARDTGSFNPRIIYFVNDDDEPYLFYIVINHIKFQLPNFTKAIDTLMKAFYVFELAYPRDCKPTLIFIQQMFYDILHESDVISINILDLVSDLDPEKAKFLNQRILSKNYDQWFK